MEVAIQELLLSFPHLDLDRNMAETLFIMHERGRLSELVEKTVPQVHDNSQEDHFIKRGSIIVTENIST